MAKPIITEPQKLANIFLQQYERYLPTAFDESLTLLQKVNKVIQQLNKIGELTNEMLDKWKEIYEWILNEGLKEAVENVLNQWLIDGTLSDLINKTIFAELNKKIEDLIAELERIKDLLSKTGLSSSNLIYQKKLMETVVGFGSTALFDGADNANQGMAYVKVGNLEKIFLLHRVAGTTWKSDERQRITEFTLAEDGSLGNPTAITQPLNLSHQGLSAIVEDGQVYLYAGMNTGSDNNSAKGFSKITWKGANTTQADIRSFQMFGLTGSGHALQGYSRATTAVSTSGEFIVLCAWDDTPQNTRWAFVYNRKEIEASNDSLNVIPLNRFKMTPPSVRGGHIVQGMACDDKYIYVIGGEVAPKTNNVINVFSMNGYQVGWFHVDGSIAEYTDSQLLSNGALGSATQMEAEGIAIRANGNLLFSTTDVWKSGSAYTRRSKLIYELTNQHTAGTQPINRGYVYRESPAPLHLYEGAYDVTINRGDALVFADYNEVNMEMKEMFGYHGQNKLYLNDVADGANSDDPSIWFVERKAGRSYAGFRAKTNNTQGAGFNAYGTDDQGGTGSAGHFIVYSNSRDGSNTVWDVRLQETGNWRPSTAGLQSMGTATYLWKNVYATGSIIQTSDRDFKTEIQPIPDAVLDAWSDVEFVQYRWKDSIERKGNEDARIHVGMIAQQIDEAFKARGLDATEYGIVGWDYPEDPEINGTDKKWSIRPDECQFLEMALMRRELKKLRG